MPTTTDTPTVEEAPTYTVIIGSGLLVRTNLTK